MTTLFECKNFANGVAMLVLLGRVGSSHLYEP